MTISIAFFDCRHCVDEFAFDWEKIRNLASCWRVTVRCPGCGNSVVIAMQGYTLIHNCDPTKYKWGEILQIQPPDANCPEFFLDRSLRMRIHQKKCGWRPG
jgi:hypothetical protein